MKNLLLLFLSIISINFSFAQQPRLFNTKLEAVTVYSQGAELNHNARVGFPAGASEIILGNIANTLDENSIQISVPTGVNILSTSFVKDYLKNENKSPAYLKVEDSLTIVRKALNNVQNKLIVEENLLILLDKNQAIGGVNNGVNVAELIKVADYYKNKQLELRNNIYTLKETEALYLKKIEKMQLQLQELSLDKSGTAGSLVLQVMTTQATDGDVTISYLSPNASWSASYDLRAENASGPLKIVYKANVNQATGIDWKKVKLSLSTGNPTQNGTAPELSTWFLQFMNPQQNVSGELKEVISGLQAMSKAKRETQLREVVVSYSKSLDKHVNQNQQTLSTTFDIDIPYDIASNSKPHSISLKEFSRPVNYKYYSIPKADGDVFLMAELTDYDKLDLLPGEANIIFENSYVGKSFINPNEATDTLNLSMGRDKKIIVKREKVAEQTGVKLIGSNKKQTFTYEINIRNGKKEAITLLLKDQYPVSTDKDMEIELLSADGASIDKETGMLSWNLKLKAGATETIRISYAVKYPKDKRVINL